MYGSEGIVKEHSQPVKKNVYGVNAVDKSTVALVAGSEKGQAELSDARRSGNCFEGEEAEWVISADIMPSGQNQ
jgi:hypothetical protein